MRRYLRSSACLFVFLAAACSHSPPRALQPKIPNGSTVAVIVFRDCLIEGQDDCHGSGARAASFFAQALSDKPRLNAVPIPRPADPTQELSDDAAVANAKDKGYDYVVNGEVMDYYYAHQPSLQRHRAALAVRVLRTSDGQVVYSYTGSGTTNNLSSPIAFIQDIAVDVQNALLDD